MGILDALFRTRGRDDATEEVIEAVQSCPIRVTLGSEPQLSENQMRKVLIGHLEAKLEVSPRAEGGVTGSGNRTDVSFKFMKTYFILSLKKGLSEQKVKNLIGEASIIKNEVKPGTRVVFIIVICPADLGTNFSATFETLGKSADSLRDARFRVDFGFLGHEFQKKEMAEAKRLGIAEAKRLGGTESASSAAESLRRLLATPAPGARRSIAQAKRLGGTESASSAAESLRRLLAAPPRRR